MENENEGEALTETNQPKEQLEALEKETQIGEGNSRNSDDKVKAEVPIVLAETSTSKIERTDQLDTIKAPSVCMEHNLASDDIKLQETTTTKFSNHNADGTSSIEEELKEVPSTPGKRSQDEILPSKSSLPEKSEFNMTEPTKVALQIVSESERSDNKTLNENISSKAEELINSLETECSAPKTAESKQLKIKKEENLHIDSLRLIAQYNSDSDADENDVMEVPIEGSIDYRNRVVEIKSESESESSPSEDSDVEYLTTIRKEIEKSVDFDDDDEDDDDEADGATGSSKRKKKQIQMRVKGELLLEDLPPIQDLHITVPEEECIELGRVHSIIDQLLLVSVIPDSLLLDLDTVLFLDKGKKVLGEVFDVLGQVADPMYCVRFNAHQEIEDKGIKIGDAVYVAPKTQYTQFVILSNLMKIRGSDASWENDIEPPPRFLDYSDDEQEREARVQLRNKDRPNDHEEPVKRHRGKEDENKSNTSMSPSGSQSTNTQRSGRFNRRSPYQQHQQHQRNQSPQSMPNAGSWHSNYRNYRSYNNPNPNMMPRQRFSNTVPSPYPFHSAAAYGPPPSMRPMQSPAPPMYVLNPLAVSQPVMSNNRPQHHYPNQSNQIRTHSPPPPPPGLD